MYMGRFLEMDEERLRFTITLDISIAFQSRESEPFRDSHPTYLITFEELVGEKCWCWH